MPTDPLQVEFIPAAPGGEIKGRYHNGLKMVLVESRRPRDWPHGATLDGLLTLDLDADHVLANAELLWPRPRWKRGEARLPAPRDGCFAARMAALSTDSLLESPEVTATLCGADLVIQVGMTSPTQRVPLGPNVHALSYESIFGSLFGGFVIINV